MKRKISALSICASIAMITLFTFLPQVSHANDNPWDNTFDGERCSGSGGYCWGGPTN